LEFAFLASTALVASMVSAIGGLGGGLILYFAMLLSQPLSSVIPLHGATMLVSNVSRLWLLKSHVQWNLFRHFVFGVPIGAVIAVRYLGGVPSRVVYILLLLLIAYSLFKPKKLPEIRLPPRAFFLVGIAAGLLSILIGATGALVKPLFNRSDLTKEQIISSEAVFQAVTHLVKVPAFLWLGFAYRDRLGLILAMGACALIGSYSGVRVLRRVPGPVFRWIFRIVLTLGGAKILYTVLNAS
jgi:uncharacterized membrane protein YfcA